MGTGVYKTFAGTDARNKGLDELRAIGSELDRDEYPIVCTNGLVMPGSSRREQSPGIERNNVSHREAGTARPTAGQGEGTAGGGAAAEGAQALLFSVPGLSEDAANDLGWALAAYPSLRVRVAPPIVWLLSRNHPVNGLPDEAFVLTALPLTPGAPVDETGRHFASWAWWEVGIWIGPRHTNFGDGSICSFEPRHGTWNPGDPVLTLLDLHAVWVARHLYLRVFSRWPGDQVLHTANERMTDHKPGELCGCGSLQRYSECHESLDRARSAYDRHLEFRLKYPNPLRRPSGRACAELQKSL